MAKEFKTDDRPEWYAATPPGECLKILMGRMAANRKLKMLYADVSRAYFYAAAVRPVFVKLPDEDFEDEGCCFELVHGVQRDFESLGLQTGNSQPLPLLPCREGCGGHGTRR